MSGIFSPVEYLLVMALFSLAASQSTHSIFPTTEQRGLERCYTTRSATLRLSYSGYNHPYSRHIPTVVPRPTILVAEPEPDQALSVRKLVLETAKFNVLTAHSTREALDIFGLFPNINAAVLVNGDRIDCDLLGQKIKSLNTKIPTLGIRCENVDYRLPSYEPEVLLEKLRELLGDPRDIDRALSTPFS